MKDRKSFVAGFLAGMSPPSVFEQSQYPRLEGSDMSKMRSDVEKVGKDFSRVMDREKNGQKAASANAQARPK